MSEPITRMKNLIPSLPEKDIELGFKFLEKRDFQSLQELVDSARYKVKKSQDSGNPKPQYANIDMGKLNELKAEVDTYAYQLLLPEQEEEEGCTDFDEEEMWGGDCYE